MCHRHRKRGTTTDRDPQLVLRDSPALGRGNQREVHGGDSAKHRRLLCLEKIQHPQRVEALHRDDRGAH
jgi:hypothetical protein